MTDRELMQMALDALDKAAKEIYSQNDDDEIGHARRALRAALAQPEIPKNLPIANLKQDELMYPTQFKQPDYSKAGFGQPQREWQGLTDEEIKEQADLLEGEWISYEGFARAIEAKLKEKNA